MKFLKNISLLILLSLWIFSNEASMANETEQYVSLWEVPKYIISAAKEEISGVRILSAVLVETKDGKEIYELQGEKNQQVYKIRVDINGAIVKTMFIDETKSDIPLNKIPRNIISKAEDRVDGINIVFANMIETLDGEIIYELIGQVKNDVYHVRIDAEGEVLKVYSEAEGE